MENTHTVPSATHTQLTHRGLWTRAATTTTTASRNRVTQLRTRMTVGSIVYKTTKREREKKHTAASDMRLLHTLFFLQ